jgi:hypothetical protein
VATSIVSTMLSGVHDKAAQEQFFTARLTLRTHHPKTVTRRWGGLGPRVCPHHGGDQRWDSTPLGCTARQNAVNMVLVLTFRDPVLRQTLVEQGLLTSEEARRTRGLAQGRVRMRGPRGQRRTVPTTPPATAALYLASPATVGGAR